MTGFKNNFTKDGNFASMIIGLIIAVFNAGCAIGGLTLSKLADKFGRKISIYISIVIYLVGTLIQITSCSSKSWVQFMVGRIVTGLAVGSTSVLCPMFISESSPLQIRGAMVVLYQLMITLGIFCGNIANYGCKVHHEGTNTEWMIPVGLGFLWGVITIVGIFFMPESAIYLIEQKHDEAEARKSISKMNCAGLNDALVNAEVERITANYQRIQQQIGDVKWNEFLVGKPKLFLRLVIGMMIMAFQQFSGANYFFYYGTSLFKSVGLNDSYVTAIILSVVNFVSTFGGVYFVEKLGRKACLLMGSIGMFICMTIYASLGSFALNSKGVENSHVGGAMIAFTCIYIFFFATTTGPVTFVVVSELYPVRVRATSMSIATSMNWISNFLISLFTPFITGAIGFKYGYVFSGCLLASAIFVWFLVPETKNLTSEEIDDLFE